MLGNMLDLCGVAMPNGRDAGNMPTSILVSAATARTNACSATLWRSKQSSAMRSGWK